MTNILDSRTCRQRTTCIRKSCIDKGLHVLEKVAQNPNWGKIGEYDQRGLMSIRWLISWCDSVDADTKCNIQHY